MSATDRLPTDPVSSLPVVAASYQRRATTPLVATPVSPLDLAQLAPGRPLLHLDEERHAQLRRLLHATPHERAQPWRVGHAHFEDELVVHLQQQPPRLGAMERAAALAAVAALVLSGHELGVDGEHGALDEVRGRALAQGVDHLPP